MKVAHLVGTSAAERARRIVTNVERVVRGKTAVVELATVALLARGHLLVEDVPGVGKTTLAAALARSIGCTFHRIQFTSDLLPSDLVGVSIYDRETDAFRFREGPLFHQLVLADEINRATPRAQSALLEAMNEGQVSVDHHTHRLPEPFLVLATQNPTEHHGTFPLPESQLDRFLMRLSIGYPDRESERSILREAPTPAAIEPVISAEEILDLQRAVSRLPVDDAVVGYVLDVVEATRRFEAIAVGASPRASQALYRAAQALALLEGDAAVRPGHVKRLAVPVLAHRLQLSGASGGDLARAEGVVRALLETVAVPL